MKINDFLRMKITPGDKQFDMIRNIRFLDERREILAGKGTTTVNGFCEAFFDYVYRNYSTARGAEKLIKQNRKKYMKYSGSENMLLVQRIIAEIIKDYAIATYFITCEMDPAKTKKAPAKENEKQPQEKEKQEADKIAPVRKETVNPAAQEASYKIRALKNELGRMQTTESKGDEEEIIRPATEIREPEPEYKEDPVYSEESERVVDIVAEPVTEAVEPKEPEVEDDITPDTEAAEESVTGIGFENIESEDAAYETGAEAVSADESVPKTESEIVAAAENEPEVETGTETAANEEPADETVTETAAEKEFEAETGTEAVTIAEEEPVTEIGSETVEEEVPLAETGTEIVAEEEPLADMRTETVTEEEPLADMGTETVAEEAPLADMGTEAVSAEATAVETGTETVTEEEPLADTGTEAVSAEATMTETGTVTVADAESAAVTEIDAKVEEEPKTDIETLIQNDYGKEKETLVSDKEAQETQIKVNEVIEAVPGIEDEALKIQSGLKEAEPEAAESKAEEIKAEEPKTVEPKAEEPKAEEPKAEESKAEEPKAEKTQAEEPKAEEPKAEEHKSEAAIPKMVESKREKPRQKIPVPEKLKSEEKIKNESKTIETGLEKPESRTEIPKSTETKPGNKIADKNIRKIVSDSLENNRQVVFDGPSGTGKTYHVRKYVRKKTRGYDGFKFIQLHSDFEYSDLIEGMRPANILNTTTPTSVRLDGVFKAFCRKIVEENLENAVPGFKSMYSEKKQKVVQTLFERIRDRKEAMEDGSEISFFPAESEEYIFENGVREYYFVIDELNRADVSKVFGDVLFALDEDYRGIENRFDTRLCNLKTYRIIQADDIGKANYSTSHIGYAEQMKFDCFEHGFFIPKNLHIIGTMNEIGGRSSMDFGFKHRFRWVNIDTEEIMLSSLCEIHKDRDIPWLKRFSENVNLVNKLISEGLSKEYRIGPGYFRRLNKSKESIEDVFENDIAPLLKEYLRGKPLDLAERFVSECKRALKMGI